MSKQQQPSPTQPVNSNPSATPNVIITQKRIIEINHGLSGVFGEQLQQQSHKIMECRKQIIRKLERKKKHSNILHDQLYQYLQKFPEEKSNLEQQVLTEKKDPIFEFQQKKRYEVPYIEFKVEEAKFIRQGMSRLERLGDWFGKSTIDINKMIEQ